MSLPNAERILLRAFDEWQGGSPAERAVVLRALQSCCAELRNRSAPTLESIPYLLLQEQRERARQLDVGCGASLADLIT